MADFTITTPQEWNEFLQYIYTNNTSSSSATTTATLQNDLDFSETTYYSSITTVYNVIVDGNEHKIEKVKLVFAENRQGLLIYYAINSTIKNITCENWNVVCTDIVAFFSGESLTLENVHLLNNIINVGGFYANTYTYNRYNAANFTITKCSFQSNIFISATSGFGYYGIYAPASDVTYCGLADNVTFETPLTCFGFLGYAPSGGNNPIRVYFSYCRNKMKNSANFFGMAQTQAIACYCAVTFEEPFPESVKVFEIFNANHKYISCFYDNEIIDTEITVTTDGGTGVSTAELQSKAFLKSKGWVF